MDGKKKSCPLSRCDFAVQIQIRQNEINREKNEKREFCSEREFFVFFCTQVMRDDKVREK